MNPEQEQFRVSLHDLLSASDVPAIARAWAAGSYNSGLALWRKLADLGVTALAIPSEFDGLDATATDLVVAFEELGHHAVPGPAIESVAVIPTLLTSFSTTATTVRDAAAPASTLAQGGQWQKTATEWLPRMASGETLATLALPPHAPYAVDIAVAGLPFGGTPGKTIASVDPTRHLTRLTFPSPATALPIGLGTRSALPPGGASTDLAEGADSSLGTQPSFGGTDAKTGADKTFDDADGEAASLAWHAFGRRAAPSDQDASMAASPGSGGYGRPANAAAIVWPGGHRPADVGQKAWAGVHEPANLGEIGWPGVDRAFDVGALVCAAQLVGAGQAILEQSVQYVQQRVQFGQAIGRFQAVKHHLANVRIALDFARPLVYCAAESLSSQDISAAKVAANEAAHLAARSGLQVHGAIGYTLEFDLSLWLTKVRALIPAWGTSAWHRSRLMETL